ncbi:recombinase family protein, partial [Serratia marcescens]|uniref:recombinase family protein n=1 Tax=Serratia marcescens TaxID=615 RepID=UPI0013DBA5A8
MAIYGYARVSTTDQDLSIQLDALTNAGCVVVRSDQRTGTTLEGRSGLQTILDFMQVGDVLM